MTSIQLQAKLQTSREVYNIQPSTTVYLRQGQCHRNRRGKVNCAVRGKTRRCDFNTKAQRIEAYLIQRIGSRSTEREYAAKAARIEASILRKVRP